MSAPVLRRHAPPAPTAILRHILPSSPSALVDVNGTLFYTAVSGGLWRSDGTEAGTLRVKDISRSLGSLVDVNGTLFFSASDGVTGMELWKSDGTEAGTVLFKDLAPQQTTGSSLSRFSELIETDRAVFFAADDGVRGMELWRSDGTEAGTLRVKDIWPGRASSLPS